MPAARRLCTAAAMEGKIYVFGRAASSVSEPIGLCFRPDTGKWEVLPHMPSAALPCVAVASLGRLYLFSCADEMKAGATTERFDPNKGAWEILAPIPTARRSFAAAAIAGKLYVAGGMSHGSNESYPLTVVERYDEDRGKWESLPPMRSARGACTAAASRGMLYIFGGSVDDVVPLPTVERFDPEVVTWETLPQMGKASLFCTATAVGGFLTPWQKLSRV